MPTTDAQQRRRAAEPVHGRRAAPREPPRGRRRQARGPDAAVQALVDAGWGYLVGDHRPRSPVAEDGQAGARSRRPAPARHRAWTRCEDQLEVLYHFAEGAAVVTLRVTRAVPTTRACRASAPIVPSATLLRARADARCSASSWRARPTPSRLFLPDDWPDGVYPLRKDVHRVSSEHGVEPSESSRAMPRPTADRRRGHRRREVRRSDRAAAPGAEGAGALRVHGRRRDRHRRATVRLGYVHRGIEKGAEERNWMQDLYLLERICGICSHVHATAYALGVEKLAGVAGAAARAGDPRAGRRAGAHPQPPAVAGRRGARSRVRHAVHVLLARPRDVMDLLEGLTGNRVNYSAQRAGRREVRRRRSAGRRDPHGRSTCSRSARTTT